MEDKRREAAEKLASARGSFIMGKALYLAIKALKKVDEPYREKSDIADMELLSELFMSYREFSEIYSKIAEIDEHLRHVRRG